MGVIDVALLGIIRRWHLRDQVPLREIAKRLGISRNTVRRYLRSETTEPAYAERQSASAIDPYAFQLSGWLKTEAAKSRKQRRSLKQLHEDLSELGFKGSYDRVAAFARQWREGQTEWVNSARKRTARGPPGPPKSGKCGHTKGQGLGPISGRFAAYAAISSALRPKSPVIRGVALQAEILRLTHSVDSLQATFWRRDGLDKSRRTRRPG